MMKSSTKQVLRAFLADRPYVLLAAAVIVTGLLFAIWCGLAVHPADIQVVTRYTAFGSIHFYKGPWWLIYNFALFALIAGIGHAAIMARLHTLGHRDLGIMFGWMTFVVLLIATFYMSEILNLAFI